MVTILEAVLIAICTILFITVLSLISAAETERRPQGQQQQQRRAPTNTTPISIQTQEHTNNIRILERENARLTTQIANDYRPGCLLMSATQNLEALTASRAQISELERLLQEANAEKLVLEHEKAGRTTPTATGSTNPPAPKAEEKPVDDETNLTFHVASEEDDWRASRAGGGTLSYTDLWNEYCKVMFKNLEKGDKYWRPRFDNEIVRDLQSLSAAITNWSKQNFGGKLGPLKYTLEDADYESLVGSLKYVVLKDGKLPAVLESGKGAALLLRSLCLHEIYDTIFRNSFSCMGPEGQVFNEFYEKMLSYKDTVERDVHLWRCSTLRRLRPKPDAKNSRFGEAERIEFDRKIQQLSEERVQKFLQGPARFIMGKHLTEDISKKLVRFFIQAAELSYYMATQEQKMEFSGLDELDAKDMIFDTDNKEIKPTSLVRWEKREDRMKGRPIQMVVHPRVKITAIWSETRATEDKPLDYSKDILWMPAEVWLENVPT